MIFGGDDNTKAASWKKKYYDSLEQAELKEKEWSNLEKTLRNAMSRMSVAMEGMDSELDQHLELLRQSIRHGDHGNKLNQIINSVIKGIERIERERKSGKKITPADALEILVDSISFPKGTARRTKALKKQLDNCDDEAALKHVIREFSELIREAFNLLRTEDTKTKKKDTEKERDKGGLLDKFFGKDQATDTKQSSTSSDNKTEQDAVVIAHNLIATLLEKVVVPQRRTKAIQEIKRELTSINELEEMHHLARKIAIQLSVFDEGMESQQSAEYDDISINEMLLQLLEKISFPHEHNAQVEIIQGILETEVDINEWPRILESIANLVTIMREKAQQEKREVETFLTQLTSQLHELDNYVQSVESDQLNSSSSDQSLGDQFRDHVRIIETSMREAADIGQLKTMVQQQMTTINKHMEHFLEERDALNAKADQRIHDLNAKLRALEQESDALKTKIVEQRKLALLDSLTEINNRLAYNERIEQEHQRWKRYHSPLSLMVVDIDFFKKINDSYGHIAGDKVLKKIAGLLQENIRETDFLARYGGEEFAIIMSETHAEDAKAVAEKLRHEVENCGFHYRDEHVTITVSCGITEFIDDDTTDSAFDRADAALYKAKDNGRNRCELG